MWVRLNRRKCSVNFRINVRTEMVLLLSLFVIPILIKRHLKEPRSGYMILEMMGNMKIL